MQRFIKRLVIYFMLFGGIVYILDKIAVRGLILSKDDNYYDLNILVNKEINEELVIIGSSRAWNHFNPQLIDSSLNLKSRVIGLSGAKSIMQNALTTTFLNKPNIKGKTLVHVIGSLEAGARSDGVFKKYKFIPFLSNNHIYSSLKKIDRNLYLDKFFPLFKFKGFYKYLFQGIKANFLRVDNYNKYKGFRALNNVWDGQLPKESYNIHKHEIELSLRLLEEEIRLAKEAGVKLIILYPPEHILTNQIINNKEVFINKLRTLGSTNRDVIFMDYSNWENNSNLNLFHNASHLNGAGASLFSVDFSKDVEKFLSK